MALFPYDGGWVLFGQNKILGYVEQTIGRRVELKFPLSDSTVITYLDDDVEFLSYDMPHSLDIPELINVALDTMDEEWFYELTELLRWHTFEEGEKWLHGVRIEDD
jgi:hypothetical protein